ncbi:hypothetical protein, partial [Paenibacillus alvei]|uniref:hypothetical protein n=1 Tax=Paenibacillus alvei TaxID=44250 RepID=UPI0022835F26
PACPSRSYTLDSIVLKLRHGCRYVRTDRLSNLTQELSCLPQLLLTFYSKALDEPAMASSIPAKALRQQRCKFGLVIVSL